MARVAKLASNAKRKEMYEKTASLRAELKKKIRNVNLPEDDRFEAQMKLQGLPRNSSPVRFRNRCELTGRPRGFYRKFRISRISLRELANQGMIPGVTKSSW